MPRLLIEIIIIGRPFLTTGTGHYGHMVAVDECAIRCALTIETKIRNVFFRMSTLLLQLHSASHSSLMNGA